MCSMFFRYSITKAFVIAFIMTFISLLDVPVFWPILLCYWIVLFVLTMKRQILHMIKYKYVPFDIGKRVSKYILILSPHLFGWPSYVHGESFLTMIGN